MHPNMLTLDEFWVVEHLDVFLCVWNFSHLQNFFKAGREASRVKFMLTVSVSIHLPNKLFKILLKITAMCSRKLWRSKNPTVSLRLVSPCCPPPTKPDILPTELSLLKAIT